MATATYGLVKYQTIPFTVTLGASPDTVTNASLVTTSGLLAGALKTFLSTVFASDAACETAFRALGGYIEMRQISGTATSVLTVAWTTTGGTVVPFLTITNGANQLLELRIVVPHSIVQ